VFGWLSFLLFIDVYFGGIFVLGLVVCIVLYVVRGVICGVEGDMLV